MLHDRNGSLGMGVLMAGVVAVIAACSSPDAVVAPPPNTGPGQYWALRLEHHAVTMSTVAPYDTIRLTATPSDVAGNRISDSRRPTFGSSDTTTLQVDSNGVVHAIATGNGIRVIASLSRGDLTLADTAMVNITSVATPPTLAVLSIHPSAGDSAVLGAGDWRTLPLQALDASGAAIAGLSVYYTTSAPATATIDRATGFVQGLYPGRVTFTANATAYGVTKADTLPFVISYPVGYGINITPKGFDPNYLTLGTGALVGFANPSTTTKVNIIFDNPASVDSSALYCQFLGATFPWFCDSGNIAPFARDSTSWASAFRIRTFPKPGTYTYHSTLLGMSGKIVIVDWRTL